MRLSIVRLGILLTSAALWASAATAQTELFFATGVDRTGWAQAQSNADGHVLIESPQYPRGLWLHLVDEAGDALAGLQVEYQGRPDSLVVLRCVDLAGDVRETLIWTQPDGTPLRLTLKPRETADLPAGLAYIDWRIDPTAEVLLGLEEVPRLIGWEAVAAFLRARWQGQAGRVAVQLDANTLAVELGDPESIETLVAHLRQVQQSADAALGEISPWKMRVFAGSLGLREGVILIYTSLFDDSNLEEAVRRALDQVGEVSSLDGISAAYKSIHSLAGIEYFTALRSLDLSYNQIADLTPLKQLTNLNSLILSGNQIVDLDPLNQLIHLSRLSLGGNQIVDLDPLANLTNLSTISLWSNQIVDLTPLNQLTNLTWLSLNNNQIVDLTSLNRLIHLKVLTLSGNQIVDLDPLNQLIHLAWIELDNNQITDLDPLASLTNLSEISLEGNQIVDLTPLKQLDLAWLGLGDNQIADLTPLKQLNILETLKLDNNQIVDLTPLDQLTNLYWLNLDHNQIADLSPLVANTGLGEGGWVNLSANPLSTQARNEQIPALEARGVEVIF